MRILVFGDSITQGFHDQESGGWCNRLIIEVMKREVESNYEYNKSVINLGISGDRTGDVLKRVKSETEARVLKYAASDYDVLLLAVGVNDSQFVMDTRKNEVSVEEVIQNLKEILKQTKGFVGKVVLLGIAPVFDNRIQPMVWKATHGYANEDIARYNAAIQSFAEENGCLFINMDDVYGEESDTCLPDGIHPNAEGHRRIYEKVKNALEAEGIL